MTDGMRGQVDPSGSLRPTVHYGLRCLTGALACRAVTELANCAGQSPNGALALAYRTFLGAVALRASWHTRKANEGRGDE